MATQPITPNELIEAAKRLRRRGMKTNNSVKMESNTEYILTEIGRLQQDLKDVMDTYFTLGSRLVKGFRKRDGEDAYVSDDLKKASSNILEALEHISDATDVETSKKSVSVKDMDNTADEASSQIKDLLNGIDDQLELVSRLASKFGNRDLIHATEMLSTDLSNTMEILKGI